MISYEEISAIFEAAVEKRIGQDNSHQDSRYTAGVVDALGWVLEEYDEEPI